MIKEVEGFPWEAEFAPAETAGILRAGDTWEKTQTFYTVTLPDGTIIMAVGVAVWTYVRKPELWVILTRHFTARFREALEATREVCRVPGEKYPNLICEVRGKRDLHFAKHFGFRETGERCLRPEGEAFIQLGM